MEEASKIKERIVSIIRLKGPNFPSPIASEIGISILFTSAFLSELLSEKILKISNMRIGSSPLYFIPGQEPQLERYSHHLKSREKDAFMMLKEKKFLKDIEQEPAIRVALRAVRDFAIPFEHENELYWRFFTSDESEFTPKLKKEIKIIHDEKPSSDEKIEVKEKTPDELNIFEKEPETKKVEKIFKKENKPQKEKTKNSSSKKSPSKTPAQKKKDENFFNKIKEYLSNKNIELLDIINFSKGEAILKTRRDNSEELLFAFNQKKISEKEILKASKKSSEHKLNYTILSLGEPPKKLDEMIKAIKKLSYIDTID